MQVDELPNPIDDSMMYRQRKVRDDKLWRCYRSFEKKLKPSRSKEEKVQKLRRRFWAGVKD